MTAREIAEEQAFQAGYKSARAAGLNRNASHAVGLAVAGRLSEIRDRGLDPVKAFRQVIAEEVEKHAHP